MVRFRIPPDTRWSRSSRPMDRPAKWLRELGRCDRTCSDGIRSRTGSFVAAMPITAGVSVAGGLAWVFVGRTGRRSDALRKLSVCCNERQRTL